MGCIQSKWNCQFVGKTDETRELINKVLSYLMIKPPAREVIQTNHKIRDMLTSYFR